MYYLYLPHRAYIWIHILQHFKLHHTSRSLDQTKHMCCGSGEKISLSHTKGIKINNSHDSYISYVLARDDFLPPPHTHKQFNFYPSLGYPPSFFWAPIPHLLVKTLLLRHIKLAILRANFSVLFVRKIRFLIDLIWICYQKRSEI